MQTLLLTAWIALGIAAQSGVVLKIDWSRAPHPDAELAAVRGEYVDAINARDANRAAALYAPDALTIVGGATVLRGAEAVGSRLRDGFGAANANVTLMPLAFSIVDRVGSETGTYTVNGATAGAPAFEGVYVTIYSRGTDGRWRIAMEVRTPTSGGLVW